MSLPEGCTVASTLDVKGNVDVSEDMKKLAPKSEIAIAMLEGDDEGQDQNKCKGQS
jgi:hypothetical protein